MLSFTGPIDLRGGCAGPCNPGRLLRPLTAMGLPRAPTAVHNRTDLHGDRGGRRPPSGTVAMDRMLRTAGAEFIDWGTALGGARAAQAAERLVPGLSLPHAFYTLYAALTHAAQGRLLAAVHRLPVLPLLAEPARRLLTAALGEEACAVLRTLPDHAPVVFGLAACALLHHVSRSSQPRDEATPDAGARTMAVVAWLRRLRAALDTVGSLRTVLNKDALPRPRGAEPSSALRSVHHNASMARHADPLSEAFPAAAAAMHAAADDCGPPHSGVPGGACAGGRARQRGGGRPPRPVKPLAKPGLPRRHPGSQGGSSRRVTVTRIVPSHVGAPHRPPPHGAAPARANGGGTALHDGAPGKESTAVARSRPGKAGAGAGNARRSDYRGHPRVAAEAPAPGSDGNTPDRTPRSGGQAGPASAIVAPTAHPCLHYPGPHLLARQIIHAQAEASGVTYCLPPSDVPALHRSVASGVPSAGGVVFWTRAQVVPQSLPKAPGVKVIRHLTVQDLHRAQAQVTNASLLADDEAWSVLTISVRPDHPLRHHPVTPAPLLEANTFRFIRVPQWDGTNRTFLAYFLNDGGAVCRGFNTGWLDVRFDARGRPSLMDTRSGYALSSATVGALAWNVARISGSRLLQGGEGASAPLYAVQNLQVAEKDTWCGRRPHDVQTWNPDLALLPVESFRMPGAARPVSMFKGSFTLGADTLLYKDFDGRAGRLQLEPTNDGQHAFLLHSEWGNRDRFLLDKGLRTGVRYEALELVELLEAQDFIFIPPPPGRPFNGDDDGQDSGAAS